MYVQTVVPGRTGVDADDSKLKNNMNTNTVLDGDAPYPLSCKQRSLDPTKVGSFTFASGVFVSAGDSLSLELDSKLAKVVSIDESFKHYVMFKSFGQKSNWVALQYERWSWKGTSTFAAGSWALSNTAESLDAPQSWPDQPVWTETVQDSKNVADN